MKKIGKRLLLSVVCICLMSGCSNSIADKEIIVNEKPSFETQVFQADGFTIELPKGWTRVIKEGEEPSKLVYTFVDENAEVGSQLFTLTKFSTSGELASLPDTLMRYDEKYRGMVKTQFPSNKDFMVGYLTAPIGDIIAVNFTIQNTSGDYDILQETNLYSNTVGDSYQLIAIQKVDKDGKLKGGKLDAREAAYHAVKTIKKS
ncbi:MAG: hypothetical protein RR646_07135 [Erysipelotrichaceae bacterium]